MSGDPVERIDELRRAGHFTDAAAAAEAAVANAPEDPDLLLELGHCRRLEGDFAAAEVAYERAMELSALNDDDLAQIDALMGLAATYRGQGRLRQARGLAAEATDLAEAAGDAESLPFLYWLSGGIERFAGQLDAALETLDRGLYLARQLDDREGEAYLLAALGGAYRVAGRFADSAGAYEEAYAAFRELGDAFGTAYTACGRGNAARMAGDWAEADRWFGEAADRYRGFGDKVSYAYTLWAWGTLAKLQGDHATARERFDAAAELFGETGDKRGLGYTELGELELVVLEGGEREPAAAAADGVAAEMGAMGYALEAAYGRLLAALARGDDPAAALAAVAATGSDWRGDALPLNLP